MIEQFSNVILEKITLEYVSEVISGYYTGSQITRFFERAGFPEYIHDGSTKKWFVYNSLLEIQTNQGNFVGIQKIIEQFADPKERVNPSQIDLLSSFLGDYNLEISPSGKVVSKSILVQSLSKSLSSLDNTSLVKTIKIFYGYARNDQELRNALENHMSNLKHLYHLETWFDREILPGENWKEAIDEHLNTADLILLLISPDFMASHYCYHKEMHHALERHIKNEARVIPIILRPVHWANAPFSNLQILPKDSIPVITWKNIDDAFLNIVMGIEKVLQDFFNIASKSVTPPIFQAIFQSPSQNTSNTIDDKISQVVSQTEQEIGTNQDNYDEIVRINAIHYLISGNEAETADILSSCTLRIQPERNDFGDEYHVALLRGPRNAYEILKDSYNNILYDSIMKALDAVISEEYYIRYIRIKAKNTDIATAQKMRIFNQANLTKFNDMVIWKNIAFRTESEKRIAVELDNIGVFYIANGLARITTKKINKSENERKNREPDFIIYYKGHWGILEVDDENYGLISPIPINDEQDKEFQRYGIKVKHYSANECYHQPKKVIIDFLNFIR
jgi:hypothetical protein